MVVFDGVKNVVGVLSGISLRKKLRKDVFEGVLVHHASRTFLLEAPVDELDLLPGELGGPRQFGQLLGPVANRVYVEVVELLLFRHVCGASRRRREMQGAHSGQPTATALPRPGHVPGSPWPWQLRRQPAPTWAGRW